MRKGVIFNNHNQLLHSCILAFGNHPTTNLYYISNKTETAYYLSKVANEIHCLNGDVNYSGVEWLFHVNYVFFGGLISNCIMSSRELHFDNSCVATSRFFYEDILSLVYIKQYANETGIDVPYIDLLLHKFSVKYDIDIKQHDHVIRRYKKIKRCINKLQQYIV